jgi:hypothetical protein
MTSGGVVCKNIDEFIGANIIIAKYKFIRRDEITFNPPNFQRV